MEKNIVLKILGQKEKPKNLLVKSVLSILCLIFLPLHIGFYEGCSWCNYVAYNFCHVNIFHLVVNLMVLWSIKNNISSVQALAIAVVASFLPMYVNAPTMGLSGFLFASFGIMWGKTGRWFEAVKKVIPFILCTMVIPNVNGLLHLYAFILGYFYGYIVSKF